MREDTRKTTTGKHTGLVVPIGRAWTDAQREAAARRRIVAAYRRRWPLWRRYAVGAIARAWRQLERRAA